MYGPVPAVVILHYRAQEIVQVLVTDCGPGPPGAGGVVSSPEMSTKTAEVVAACMTWAISRAFCCAVTERVKERRTGTSPAYMTFGVMVITALDSSMAKMPVMGGTGSGWFKQGGTPVPGMSCPSAKVAPVQ